MAKIIHLEPEQVSTCAAQLQAEGEVLRQRAQSLLVAGRSMDWYGYSREIFQDELEKIVTAMTRLADDSDILAGRLYRELEQWQQVDAYFAQQFSEVIFPITE